MHPIVIVSCYQTLPESIALEAPCTPILGFQCLDEVTLDGTIYYSICNAHFAVHQCK